MLSLHWFLGIPSEKLFSSELLPTSSSFSSSSSSESVSLPGSLPGQPPAPKLPYPGSNEPRPPSPKPKKCLIRGSMPKRINPRLKQFMGNVGYCQKRCDKSTICQTWWFVKKSPFGGGKCSFTRRIIPFKPFALKWKMGTFIGKKNCPQIAQDGPV